MVTDCYQLIAILTPRHMQALKLSFDGLLLVMTDKDVMHSIEPRHGAFARAVGQPLSIAEWIVQPKNATHLTQLTTGMPWLTRLVAGSIVGIDCQQWGPTARVCDMGCADGGIMSLVKAKVPSLHIVCQDLAVAIPMAQQTFASAHPGAAEHGEVEFIEHDFFQTQKTEADVYWLRGVLHDYTDAECVQVLRQIAPQLQRNHSARVLINEIVKPSLVVSDEQRDQPASSLVSRKQSAFLEMSSLMQLHTTAFLNGKERSYDDFAQLFADAGYRIVRYNRLHVFTAIIEICLSQ
ncbi:hypothetical protein SCUCBS95973_002895 [Sporothrix curviconia]|uniref:O-methyltransferase C-terminal domain-containing protein n=1 Tax=Sporothrix curviconia TaxID=1260050 RepID=A0ABP0BAT7_9PEZI